VAAAFAAQHPERVEGLILVSAIPPSWTPDARVRLFLRSPWLLSPLFCLGSLRLYPEIAAAASSRLRALTSAGGIAAEVLTHMFSPPRMARRATLLPPPSLNEALAAVKVPALVIAGDAALERVVPVAMTREYLRLLPHAEWATLPRTGHLGLITKPTEFAELVGDFTTRAASARLPEEGTRGRRLG